MVNGGHVLAEMGGGVRMLGVSGDLGADLESEHGAGIGSEGDRVRQGKIVALNVEQNSASFFRLRSLATGQKGADHGTTNRRDPGPG